MTTHVGSSRIWKWGFALIFAINVFGLHYLFTWEQMWTGQENHDTRVMYKHILLADDPLKWFKGDWPLYNGFYRPLPSLAFEADVRFWGDSYRKYKLFNWGVGTACAFLLLGLVWSLTGSRAKSMGTAALFSVWQTGLIEAIPVESAGSLFAAAVLIFGLASKPGQAWRWLVLAASLVYLGYELAFPYMTADLTVNSFGYRVMGWPPGRTATLFALHALACLYGYCQWERYRGPGWLLLAGLGFVGAFLSYEQAVTLPVLLAGCAVFLGLQGVKISWAFHLVAWLLMAVYALWHVAYLPVDPGYASIHGRGWQTGLMSLVLWAVPGAWGLIEFRNFFDPSIGLYELLIPSFWAALVGVTANLAGWIVGKPQWKLLLFALAMSLAVYAPMAFQLQLNHYLYLPAAFRALFVVVLAEAVILAAKTLLESLPKGLPERERSTAMSPSDPIGAA